MGKEMCDSCDKGFITRVTEPSLVLWSQQLNLDPFYSWLCPQLFGGLNVQMLYLGFNPFWVTLCIWLEENSPRLHGYSAVLYLLKGILMDFWYPCWLLFINFGVVKSSLRQAWGTWCSLVWAACTEDHVFNSHGGRNAVKIHVCESDPSVSLTVPLLHHPQMTLRDTSLPAFAEGPTGPF